MATTGDTTMTALEPLIGEWGIHVPFGDEPSADAGARVRFEWMPGKQFVIERWEIPAPEAPDGIAIIGPDPEREGDFLQHYFDTRGVARVYRMRFRDDRWLLERDTADFSPLDFAQRYIGSFSADGKTITGAWEIAHDGVTWEHDFDITYTRLT